jgi:tryptophan 2,3-dioxygenase
MSTTALHYQSYLQLDKVLHAQQPQSALHGQEAHDEMLFIVIHQVYELWFKQILHEIDLLLGTLTQEDTVDERAMGKMVETTQRIIKIQEVLIQQVGVLDTMTSLDFLEFRNYLFPASGFQSFQFRMLEVKLGLPRLQREQYNNIPYAAVFPPEQQAQLEAAEAAPSLLAAVAQWLERTPFVQFQGWDFVPQYKAAVARMFEEDRAQLANNPHLTDADRRARQTRLQDAERYIFSLLDPQAYAQMQASGQARISHSALMAALLINLYRDQPILHLPYALLNDLLQIDEHVGTWRYRHSMMVLKMLGRKMGTGGSSGHEYLQKTVAQHSIFSDLYLLKTLLIPRSHLPQLPEGLKKSLGFSFGT